MRLETYLTEFRPCFTREAAFKWFVIIVIAFMQRGNHLGMTSIIRNLMLDGNCYECMRAFFYSSAWNLETLRGKWYAIVKNSGLVYKVHGRTAVAGDRVKQSKEARYMPGVKKMVQESEDSSKAQFIIGHLLGAVGVILGKTKGLLCLPLKMNIQDGLHAAASWDGSDISSESHVGSAGDLLQFFLCFHDIYLPSKSDSITQYAEKTDSLQRRTVALWQVSRPAPLYTKKSGK